MTNFTRDIRQLSAEAEALGYGKPSRTKTGHLVWVHSKTKRRVVASPNSVGRGLRNARATLRRCAREEAGHASQ